MVYSVAADIVLIVHLSFVLFVAAGGLLVLWRWKIAWVHLPAVCWGIWIEFSGAICPLTPLEVWLRRQGGAAGYDMGFVEHYLVPLLYPANLTREIQMILGLFVLILNLAVYGVVAYRARSFSRSGK